MLQISRHCAESLRDDMVSDTNRRSGLSRHRLYDQMTLRGPVPRRLVWAPDFPPYVPASLERAFAGVPSEDALLTQAGADPSSSFHRLAWLALSRARDPKLVALIIRMVQQWTIRFGGFHPHIWAPGVAAERLTHLLLHIGPLTDGQDGPFREALLGQLARHIRHLRRVERRLPMDSDDSLGVALTRALGVIALPEDESLGEVISIRMEKLFERVAGGHIPTVWRLPERLTLDYCRLEALVAAYGKRRLTMPPALPAARTVAREVMALTCAPDGRPARWYGAFDTPLPNFRASRSELSAGARHHHALGRFRLMAAATTLYVDGGQGRDPSGAGSFCLYDGDAPVIVACGRPSPMAALLTPELDRFRSVLDQAAAASGLDTLAPVIASVRAEAGEEGHLIDLQRVSGSALHRRRLLLKPGGEELLGEDLARGGVGAAVYRFHLAEGVSAVGDPSANTVTIRLTSGAQWTLFAHQGGLALEESVSAWADGQIIPTRQIVLTPSHEGIRWALRKITPRD